MEREMRKPFIKNILEVPSEAAHGGSGSRRVLLSGQDAISSKMEIMTKGVLPVGGGVRLA
jgi:hypothetical protein